MKRMTDINELKTLREREDHIEFKRAEHNYPFAGGKKTDPRDRRHCVLGYVVALANERGGRLVLGMADAYPHEVVGSDFAENETGNLEDEIYERLHIRVRTEELYNEKGRRVLVITVPSRPIGKALRFEGVPLMRVGESLREMDDAEYFSIISEQDPDFSARICEGLTLDDLHDEAIKNMRERIAQKRNRKDVLTTPINLLLSDLHLLTNDGKLTNAALLLLGKEAMIEKYMPQANVVVEYRTNRSQVRYSSREEFRLPIFLAIEKIWAYVNQPACNPLLHINDLPAVLDCRAFNEETVREAVINAMIHRSLQISSDIFIRLYPDMMEITNPGGFPYGVNIGNILTVNSSPRSRLMAEVIEKTGLIERSGQGVDLMCANCVKEGKPLPDYSASDDYQVNLRLYGEIPDDAFYLFTHDILRDNELSSQLNAFDWITLHYVWKGKAENGFEESLMKLNDLGLVMEDTYFRYVLAPAYVMRKPIARAVAQDVEPVVLARVYYVIKRNGEAAMSEFVEVLDGILSQKQVRTLIEKLCRYHLLSQHGNARATRYVWAAG
ncbi:MAG: putative DNA binding domain-containing protein [Bacteroidales bacterium]|nr:putative DNA binding domain-containing protein [Bacteroidales bacterium]